MAADLLDPAMLRAIQAAAALVFLALLLRLALLLGATPVAVMTREILYLQGDLFRPLVRLVLLFLVLEGLELLLPSLGELQALPEAWVGLAVGTIDLVQAVLLVVLAAGTLRAFSPYSRRSLADLETVARRGVEVLAGRIVRRPAQAGKGRRGS